MTLLLGDGAAGFSLMDVDTLVRHNLPVVMVMGNNSAWGLEKGPMQMLYGYDVIADLAPPGSVIWLRDMHRDTSFGLLARVEADGVDVGAELSARGMAAPEKKTGISLHVANGKSSPALMGKSGISCAVHPVRDADN